MTFGMIVEDPFYDEDGVLIDEDGEFEEPNSLIAEIEAMERAAELENFDPFETINS